MYPKYEIIDFENEVFVYEVKDIPEFINALRLSFEAKYISSSEILEVIINSKSDPNDVVAKALLQLSKNSLAIGDVDKATESLDKIALLDIKDEN